VPWTVVFPRVLRVALITLALTAGVPVAAARAESLTIAAGSDPVAGMANGIDYEYDTSPVTLNLQVIARPAAGPACQPTSVIDAAAVGAAGGSTFVTPAPISLSGTGLGRVPFTFAAPGPVRVCAWLSRSPDDVVVVAGRDVEVRAPQAAVAVTARQVNAHASGSDLAVHVTGTVEAASDLFVTVVSGATTCPPTYEEETDPAALDVTPAGTATRVTGAFALDFSTRDPLSYRRWRLCAFLQDGTTSATASTTGTTLVDLVLAPKLLSRPRARQQGHAIACDGGRWRSKPTAKLTYAWLRGTARIPGAKGRRLPVTAKRRGTAIRCRVTARNALGRASATSKPVTAR
jgi:hypothetical protein